MNLGNDIFGFSGPNKGFGISVVILNIGLDGSNHMIEKSSG